MGSINKIYMNSLTSAKGCHDPSVIYGLVYVYSPKYRKGSNPAKVLREPLNISIACHDMTII